MGPRADVISDGRAQCAQASEDVARVADYCFKKGGVSLCHHFPEGENSIWKKSSLCLARRKKLSMRLSSRSLEYPYQVIETTYIRLLYSA